MPKNKKPPFRRSQFARPPKSERHFGKVKVEKKTFDVYVIDIETGDETLAITIFAATQREAIQIAKKLMHTSPILRRITYAAFTAVEVGRERSCPEKST